MLLRSSQYTNTSLFICIYFKLSFGSCDRQAGTNFKAEYVIAHHQDVTFIIVRRFIDLV